jgi:hypothetical protein
MFTRGAVSPPDFAIVFRESVASFTSFDVTRRLMAGKDPAGQALPSADDGPKQLRG